MGYFVGYSCGLTRSAVVAAVLATLSGACAIRPYRRPAKHSSAGVSRGPRGLRRTRL